MTKVKATKDEKQITDKATYWFALLRSGTCEPGQRRAFDLWLSENPQHESAYQHLQAIWNGCDALADDPEILRIRRRAWEGRRASLAGVGAIAAAVALFVLTAGVIAIPFMSAVSDAPSRSLMAETANEFMIADRQSRHYRTTVGERSHITLPDQSVVDLNTDTEILTLYTEHERRIIMVRGQALFNVAHDPDRPFSVLASGQVITALGTEFEVHLNQGEVAVTLLEGRVTVDALDIVAPKRSDKRSDAISSDSDSKTLIELVPGQRFETTDAGPAVVSAPDVEDVIDWKDGILSFNGEPLETIVYEMNRYSDQKIIIEGESLKQLSTGGTFKAGVPDGFIAAMVYNYPIKSETDPETGAIILRWIENP